MTTYQLGNHGEDGYTATLDILAESIAGWRDDAGVTLKELAMETGLSISFLCDLENGRSVPSLTTLQKLANAYQRTITIDIGYAESRGR